MRSSDTGLLGRLVGASLHHRNVVIVLAAGLLAYGTYALDAARYDVFPEFAPPQVVIQTEAPGLSPEQVEILVTQPIENAINGAPAIAALRSSSIQGLSLVTATFRPRSDIYRVRQVVAERLANLAGQLPLGVQTPGLSPLTSSTSVILSIGLTSAGRSQMELRTLADWVLKPRLLAVPGVAKVSVFGGDVREIQIQVRPDRLIKYHLALDDVLAAGRMATGVRGAGFVDSVNQRVVLQSEAQALAPELLARTVLLRQQGGILTLGDVAHVTEASAPAVGAAAVMGKPGVQLVISEQYGANTLEVTQQIEAAITELRHGLEAQQVVMQTVFRPATFIQTATDNVRFSLLVGGGLVVIVLTLFLFNLRIAAIALTAIPLSLLAAVIALDGFGLTLNTMTLGGFAIAIGLLVDDAVIVVENVNRRLRGNQRTVTPRQTREVVYDAVLEVRSAVVYATIAIALVFIPVLTMTGVAGRLFAPLGMAYILATLASLLVAMTVTPALCFAFLRKQPLTPDDPLVTRWLKTRYRRLLSAVESNFRTIVACVATLTLAGLIAVPFFGGTFLPELREGHFIVHMSAVPGTSLGESLRIGERVSAALLGLPFVRTVAQRAGRAEKADDSWGTHYSEFNIDLQPLHGEEAEFVQSDIRKLLVEFPGVNFAVKSFLTERVEETLSGFTASVVINVYGDSLDLLDGKAREIATVLSQVTGASQVQVQSPPGTPQLVVRAREDALRRWGFEPLQLLEAVRTAFQGETVGQVYDGNRVFGVSVILDPALRRSIADVGRLPLRNASGTYVQLEDLATLYQTSGRYVVLHNGARRVQTITCDVAGRDVASFVDAAAKAIASQVSLPTGSYVEFGGTAQAQAKSAHDLLLHSVMTGFAIVLLLATVIANPRNLLLIFINLPFALVGGVLAVFALGGNLSIGAMVGFVTLFGITLRNSMMMLSHWEHLVEVEGLPWGPATAIRGAEERIAPILMTALVTGLGLLPLAIGSGDPGREIEGPMALVILGGLFTSTALNLLVLPGLALRHGRFEKVIEA